MPPESARVETQLLEIKTRIRAALKEQYDMDIKQFAHSKLPKRWGIKSTVGSIQAMFTPNQKSFPLYKKMWDNLFDTELTVETKRSYYIKLD